MPYRAYLLPIGGLVVAVLLSVVLDGQLSSISNYQITTGKNVAQAADGSVPAGRQNTDTKIEPPGIGTTSAQAAPKKPNYFSTNGSKIVDADGNEVHITGVNWFGMETQTFSPHGLWLRNWQDMLDQIAAAGFNTVRLPYSSAILDPNARPMEGIDFNVNPDLRGLTALQIMDKVVAGAGQRGLKIILDHHRPDTRAQSKLWYTDDLSEARWIADWQMLAKRYAGNDTVIGADLHNEPAGDGTWGSGDPKTDWRAAAEREGNAILDVNPNWLIIVEGVERIGNDWYWMGGDLANAGQYPVNLKVPNKLVYSAHDYGPGVANQGWFQDPKFPANLSAVWDQHWGYLVEQNIAPVIIGEFGGRSTSSKDTEGIWQQSLLKYMQEHDIGFTYWAWNPNSADTGGILLDDWKTLDAGKMSMLASYLAPKMAVNDPNAIDQSAVAAAPAKNALPAQPIKVQYAAGSTDASTDQLTFKLLIDNMTAAHVPLAPIELRYWLSPAEANLVSLAKTATFDGKKATNVSVVGIDWASAGSVAADLLLDKATGLPYVRVTFPKDPDAMDSYGKVEVQLRITKPTTLAKEPFVQADEYSFKPSKDPVDDEAVSLYLWGDRAWGNDPTAPAAATTDGANASAPNNASDAASSPTMATMTTVRLASTPNADNAASTAATDAKAGANGPSPSASGTATSASASSQEYVVKPGDTLRGIARQYYGDAEAWSRIAAANADQVKDPNRIMPGETLVVPTP